jgi:hypothetical protein
MRPVCKAKVWGKKKNLAHWINRWSLSSSLVFVERVRLRERLLSVPWDEPKDTGGVSLSLERRKRQKEQNLTSVRICSGKQMTRTFDHIDATSNGTLPWNH